MLCFRRARVLAAGVMFVCLGIAGTLLAQTDRGTITGTVTDASGGVVGGAAVSATNQATGIVTKGSTGSNGNYTIPLLPIGLYRVSVEQSGFKKSIREGVAVQVGQTVRVDIRLEVGEISQSVEVKAEAPLLRPDTSDLGTVINSQQILDLPLIGQGETRNPTFFMILVPGVTGRGTSYGGGPTFDARYLSTTVAGSQSGATEFHLDGSIIASAGEFSADPRNTGFPMDAVGEFKINTVNAPAEYGHTGGGVASFTLKSGTNALHGSVYEYFRNDALDARGFFAPTTPTNRQNEFGATAGGPIRKDKTFFFGWYNGFRLNRAASNFIETVPTTALKQGDLSAYLGPQIGSDALGRPVFAGAIYDPLTTRTVTAGQVDPVTGLTATSSATIRDPFPGNRIPSSRFDSVARNILPLFPEPTLPGLVKNFGSQGVNQTDVDQWGVKLDHSFTSNHKIAGSFFLSGLDTPGQSAYPGVLSNALPTTFAIRNFRFSEDSIFRPNLISHFVFGFNRLRSGTTASEERLGWPSKIGLKGVNPNGVFPGLNIAGQGNTYGNTGIGVDAQNHFDFNESVSWIKGKHSLKFGFEHLKTQLNNYSTGRDAGYLSFNYPATGLPGFQSGATGAGMASFLLGLVDSGEVRVYLGGNYERSAYYAGYVQDDFKFSPKLTFNMGLRYDLYRPTVDKFNNLAWVDLKAPNPALGGFPGTMIFATPERRTGVDQFNKGFAPRFGIAYSLDDKTVLRTSYGLFWAAGGYVRGSRGQYIQGKVLINSPTSPDAGLTPAFILQNGFPPTPIPSSANDPTTGFNSGVHILDREDAHPPYLQNWTLNIQRQLPGQILFDIAYVGNKGTRLQSRLSPTNQMPTQYLSLGELLFKPIGDPAVQALQVVQRFPVDPATGNRVPFVGFERIVGGSATLGQALRPTPQYGQEGTSQNRRFYEGNGQSIYHALQLKVDKRFSGGLNFLVSYTWSKTLTDAESQFSEFSGFAADVYNRRAERSVSLNDYPHNLVINYGYDLPFGPGKKWASAGGAAGKVVGGWKIAGIQQYTSGGPNIIFTGNPLWPYVGANSFMARPNVVPGVEQRSAALISGNFDPNRDAMFNPKAWVDPAPFTLGNGPRTYGNLRRFAYLNEDISLIKRTSVNETVNVEFRADFLNIFNRTVFGLGTNGDQYGSALNNFANAPGTINSQSNYPRQIQFGLRINY